VKEGDWEEVEDGIESMRDWGEVEVRVEVVQRDRREVAFRASSCRVVFCIRSMLMGRAMGREERGDEGEAFLSRSHCIIRSLSSTPRR
jgi:hypothetical protein